MKRQQLEQDAAYVDALIERLCEHYLTRTPLPGSEPEPLNAAAFYRFYRYVIAEGYGQEYRRSG
jgi:hypothetical protein